MKTSATAAADKPWDRYYFDNEIRPERQRWIIDKGIAYPDRVVHQFVFCDGTRAEHGWPYPFPGQLSDKWKGVYLLFVETKPGHRPYELFPVYAGQTQRMGHRLKIHHTDPQKVQFFSDLLDNDFTHGGLVLDPSLWFACWWIKEKHKRISAEHDLIGRLSPVLNKS